MQIQTDDELSFKVTARALLQRINRKLAKEDERLCRGRSFYDHGYGQVFDPNLGEYYRVGTAGPYSNAVTETHVDLVELARELGVMRPGETIETRPGSPEEAAEARRLMLPVDAYRMPGVAAARQKEIDDSAAVTWTLKAMTDEGLRHIAYEQRMSTDFGLKYQAEARLILESRAKAGSD